MCVIFYLISSHRITKFIKLRNSSCFVGGFNSDWSYFNLILKQCEKTAVPFVAPGPRIGPSVIKFMYVIYKQQEKIIL